MGALESEKLMNFSEQLDFQAKLLGVFPATETQRLGSWSLKKFMKFSEQLDFEVKLLYALPANDRTTWDTWPMVMYLMWTPMKAVHLGCAKEAVQSEYIFQNYLELFKEIVDTVWFRFQKTNVTLGSRSIQNHEVFL